MNQDTQKSSLASPLWRLKEAARQDQSATTRFDEAFATFLGVSVSGARCLDTVERHGRATPGRLAKELGLTTGAVTALIDRLEGAGYVRRERDGSDRRKVWIVLTGHARELTRLVFGQFAEIGALMVEGYTEAEIEAIVRFLSVSAALNAARAGLLEARVGDGAADPAARLEKASAFARDARALSGRLRDRTGAGKGMTSEMFED